MADYKNTVNLPQTGFAMKADLARREPEMLKSWEDGDVYANCAAPQRAGRALRCTMVRPMPTAPSISATPPTKILKDFIVKSRTLDGFDSPYIPGWDCHGLPIELQVEKKHGRVGQKLDARAFRAACRSYAMEQVELQRKDFKRLGVMGDWDRPYITMDSKYEAQQIPRARQGHPEWPPLYGRQARVLVPGLPLGPGRGGSGIRGQDLAGHRRGFPRGGCGGFLAAHRGHARLIAVRIAGDLDHYAVDPACE